ncbi:helix-turn-helix domain-containing protein [Novosphingobium sp. BL-8A]|uniref:ArsR/SmtB family transcription factor n=1 Tax=Novosphingobium sp. BL-8A TaxID=3127639 RepID=UPI0037576A16
MTSGTEAFAQMRGAVPIFAALGDACRLSIVSRLGAEGPLSTMRLNSAEMAVSRQGLTKHLRVLEDAGLVESFRVGRDRQWQLRPDRLETIRRYLDQVSAEWDARIERLRAFVEE